MNAIDSANISSRISEVNRRIADLRAERGRAVMNGVKFDERALDAATSELAALQDARPLAEAKEIVARRQAADDRRRELLEQLKLAEERRLSAVAEADAVTTRLIEVAVEIDAASAEVARLHTVLGIEVPATFTPINLHNRLTGMLCAKLARTFQQRIFGVVRFGHVPISEFEGVTDWKAAERKVGGIVGGVDR